MCTASSIVCVCSSDAYLEGQQRLFDSRMIILKPFINDFRLHELEKYCNEYTCFDLGGLHLFYSAVDDN